MQLKQKALDRHGGWVTAISRAAKLRQAMFDRGAAAWRAATGDPRGTYVCPLCTQGFARVALEHDVLAIEHVPPKAQGGRPLLLTCRACNSTAGHTVDAAASARDRTRAIAQAVTQKRGSATGTARLVVGGVETNVRYTAGPEGVTIVVPNNMNQPGRPETQIDFIRSLDAQGKGQDLKMTFTPHAKFHVRYAQIGDLRSAYLGAFAAYGYRYAFHPRLLVVRKQLMEPDIDVVGPAGWLLDVPNRFQNPSITGIRAPTLSLAVRVGLGVVILPWLEGPPDVYRELAKAFDSMPQVEVTGVQLGWPTEMRMVLDLPDDPIQAV